MDSTVTTVDFRPLFTREQLVVDYYTTVANTVKCIPTHGPTTDCDFTAVVDLVVQFGNDSLIADPSIVPLYAVLDAVSEDLADQFIDIGLDSTLDWYKRLNGSIPCPYIEPINPYYLGEIKAYKSFLKPEQLAMHLKYCHQPGKGNGH